MNNTFPSGLDLVTLWLQTHYQGQPAVVFSHPLGSNAGLAARAREMQKRFGEEYSMVVSCEYAILSVPTVEEAVRVMHETPECEPFTMVWNGKRVTTNH
jgi:hypothetical protein